MPNLITHVWKPGTARLVTIDSFVPVPRGAAASIPPLLSWPSKDPGDVLDYQLDVRPALTGNEEDTIDEVNLDISPSQPGDVSLDNTFADGSRIIIWLSGGQAGRTYTVTVKILFASGRALQRSILLPVVALSSTIILPNAIETAAQDPITDQDGNAILSD